MRIISICVKYRRSNVDEDGVWLFRVGDLRGENVQDPGSRAPDAGHVCVVKLEFHGTDTDTDILAETPTFARASSRGSRRVRRLPRSACHEPDTRILARLSVRIGMRACTHVDVYCAR